MKDPLTRPVRPVSHRKKNAPLSKKVVNTYRTLLVVLAFLGVSATGTYLYLSTLQPAKGYTLEQLRSDQALLEADQRKLNQQATEARSFTKLKQEDLLHSMAPLSNEQTAFLQDTAVAQAENDTNPHQYTP